MAISAATMWEIRQDATASNANGGGFSTADPSTAFLTDLAATSATGNSPVVTSASYTFVAGDDETWIYVKTGTNWTPGFYQIASVSGGAATLRAAIGEAVQYDSAQGRWKANTVAGCATTASPTGGTFADDYSQQTAAQFNLTGVTTAAADAILLTASAAVNMVGNLAHVVSGTNFTVGWYQILSVVAGVSITLDRTCTSAAGAAGVVNIGGAISLATSGAAGDDDVIDSSAAGNTWWLKYNATAISTGEAVAIGTAVGTAATPVRLEGYNSIRGDRPTGSTRPTLNAGSNTFTLGTYWQIFNIIFTTSASGGLSFGSNVICKNIKSTNSSTTPGRAAITLAATTKAFHSEAISYRGNGIDIGNNIASITGCWMHESNQGLNINSSSAGHSVNDCIISSCVTAAVAIAGAYEGLTLNSCSLFGASNKTGTGIAIATTVSVAAVTNTIISGFVTGVSHADTQNTCFDDYNCYFNNTNDVSAVGQWQKGPNDVTTDPAFTSVSQVTGTTGVFTAGNDRIVDTSKNFTSLGVVALQDHIYIVSGTGVTAGIYGITSIATTTNPNDTLVLTPAPGTNTTADKVFQICTGHNFLPTAAI